MQLNRRDFLVTSGAGALSLSCASTPSNARKPLFKISLAQRSLNHRFFKREEPQLDNLEFAKVARGCWCRGHEGSSLQWWLEVL